MRVGAAKKRKKVLVFLPGGGFFPPGAAARKPATRPLGTVFRFVVRKSRRDFFTLLCESPGGTSPLCSAKVPAELLHFVVRKSRRDFSTSLCESVADFSALLRESPVPDFATLLYESPVPGEGVGKSLCVPGGDRAPLSREFPTNSGVGVSARPDNKKPPKGRQRRNYEYEPEHADHAD